MILLFLLEVTSVVCLLAVGITQVIIPLIRGKKLFPMFRSEGSLERQLANLQQQLEEEKLKNKISQTEQQVQGEWLKKFSGSSETDDDTGNNKNQKKGKVRSNE